MKYCHLCLWLDERYISTVVCFQMCYSLRKNLSMLEMKTSYHGKWWSLLIFFFDASQLMNKNCLCTLSMQASLEACAIIQRVKNVMSWLGIGGIKSIYFFKLSDFHHDDNWKQHQMKQQAYPMNFRVRFVIEMLSKKTAVRFLFGKQNQFTKLVCSRPSALNLLPSVNLLVMWSLVGRVCWCNWMVDGY